MQKTFALRAKRVMKTVAAVGIGVAMLGATMAGALAADPTLDGYPSPFNGSDAAIIIGSGADQAAASDIALGLPTPGATSTASSGVAAAQISNNIPIGMGISNTSTNGFDWETSTNQLTSFQKGQINFQAKDYNAHDELVLSKNTPNIATSLSSRTAVQQDYEDKVFLETAARGSVDYYYSFDDAMNVSKATTAQPLNLKFLGNTLKITSVDSTDANGGTFTAYITNEYFMNVGDIVTVNGKKVKLENVGSTGAILASVDGVIDTIAASSSKVINGVEIAVDQTFYDANAMNQRAASLFIGKNALNTYKNGDAYIGEDQNNPNWIWDTANLSISASTSITQTTPGTVSVSGPKLGIKNNFLSQTSSQNPTGTGSCLNLPNNYASICMDSLTVPDTDYLQMTVALDKNEDLSRSGQQAITGSAQNVLQFSAPGDQRFVIYANTLNGANFNSTSDRKTSKIWLARIANSTYGSAASYNSTNGVQNFGVFYYDSTKTPTIQYAGYINLTAIAMNVNATYGQAQLFEVYFEDTKVNNVNVTASYATDQNATNNTIVIRLQNTADTTNDLENGGDTIQMNWTVPADIGNFSSLGATASQEEDGELVFNAGGGSNPTALYGIGRKDVDLRTRYGLVIKDPKANGASDQEVFMIPGNIVKAKVIIKGMTVQGSTAPGTTSLIMNAADVTDVTKYNAILVGGPCANAITAKVLGASSSWPDCANGFTDGQAVLQLKANGQKWALVAAGYSADDTRRAGIVLKEAAKGTSTAGFLFSGKLAPKSSLTVKGTTLDVSGISVQ